MTPQERELVDNLFDRIAALESAPRDPEAERAIREGLARAPHAVYALVQSVLVQDEALKRADARIRELAGEEPAGAQQPKGFLDNMRDALFGSREPRGSVPQVRPGEAAMGVPPQYRSGPGMAPAPMGADSYRPGGSFLGTAAAAAAGMIGGSLLLSGISGLFRGGYGQQQAGAFDQGMDPAAGAASAWDPSGGGDLGRQAGLDDIGRGGNVAGNDDGNRAGLFDTAANDQSFDADFGGDGGSGGGDTA